MNFEKNKEGTSLSKVLKRLIAVAAVALPLSGDERREMVYSSSPELEGHLEKFFDKEPTVGESLEMESAIAAANLGGEIRVLLYTGEKPLDFKTVTPELLAYQEYDIELSRGNTYFSVRNLVDPKSRVSMDKLGIENEKRYLSPQPLLGDPGEPSPFYKKTIKNFLENSSGGLCFGLGANLYESEDGHKFEIGHSAFQLTNDLTKQVSPHEMTVNIDLSGEGVTVADAISQALMKIIENEDFKHLVSENPDNTNRLLSSDVDSVLIKSSQNISNQTELKGKQYNVLGCLVEPEIEIENDEPGSLFRVNISGKLGKVND